MNECSIEPRHLWHVFCTLWHSQAINNGDIPDERAYRSLAVDGRRTG
jgi:hypothetical protein